MGTNVAVGTGSGTGMAGFGCGACGCCLGALAALPLPGIVRGGPFKGIPLSDGGPVPKALYSRGPSGARPRLFFLDSRNSAPPPPPALWSRSGLLPTTDHLRFTASPEITNARVIVSCFFAFIFLYSVIIFITYQLRTSACTKGSVQPYVQPPVASTSTPAAAAPR